MHRKSSAGSEGKPETQEEKIENQDGKKDQSFAPNSRFVLLIMIMLIILK